MAAWTIVFADDHTLVRDMLRARLMSSPAFTAVHVAPDAEGAFTLTLEHRPHVLLLDVDMPGRSAFDVAGAVKAALPRTSVVFLTSHGHDRFIQQALAVKASGYLLKSDSPEQIEQSLIKVASGGASFSPAIMDRLVITAKGPELLESSSSKLSQLSPRETEVLIYLASGLSKKEVADRMFLSVKTVQNHADRLMQKLDIHDRVELARFAIREGLVKA